MHYFIQQVKSRSKKFGVRHFEVDLASFLGPLEMPEVLSEIADVVFNLINIDDLDTVHRYIEDANAISNALGFTLAQMLEVIVAKYQYRYETNAGEKDIESENLVIRELIERGRIPVPTLGQLSAAHNEINIIASTITGPRLTQLTTEINRMLKNRRPSA